MARAILGAAVAALLVAGTAGAAAAEDEDRGRKLYELCQQCHGAAGEGSSLALAPALAGMEKWYLVAQLEKFQKGQRGGHPDDIGGLRMRPMSVWLSTPEDVQAVAAFIAAMPPVQPEPELVGGDPERGKTLYAPCIACHMPNGAGMQALNAPALTNSSDWYMLTQLKNYKSGVRGGINGDPTGAVMIGMAATLATSRR